MTTIDLRSLDLDQLSLLSRDVVAEIATRFANPSGYVCRICGLNSIPTPSGYICSNGHGGEEVPVISNPRLAVQPWDEAPEIVLNADQTKAWEKIQKWLTTDKPFFLLKGFAGTGKSFLMKMLCDLPHNFVFSAPTNKASSVLSAFIGLPVKTTYSVLGLRMTADDDQMVLTEADSVPNLGPSPILVIDEAGMIPKFMIKILKRQCREVGWRIIFVGDPAQLTPVKEARSPVWSITKDPDCRAMLREIRRFDNQLLKLSAHLRDCVIDPEIVPHIRSDNDKNEGVFVLRERDWLRSLKARTLAEWTDVKIIAWRNKTVNHYNKIVREALGFTEPFTVGESILLASPLFVDGDMRGHTDEELVIRSIDSRTFSYPEEEMEIESYVFTVNRSYSVYAPKDPDALAELLNKRARVASSLKGVARKNAWAKFWEVRHKFTPVRYGFALTAHRIQGTTVNEVYVDQRDILANPNRREAARCLYVAGTRPTTRLSTF